MEPRALQSKQISPVEHPRGFSFVYRIQIFAPVLVFFFQFRAVGRTVASLFPASTWSCEGPQGAFQRKCEWPVLDNKHNRDSFVLQDQLARGWVTGSGL